MRRHPWLVALRTRWAMAQGNCQPGQEGGTCHLLPKRNSFVEFCDRHR
jgi:hypothetical protein